MIIQNRDGSFETQPDRPRRPQSAQPSYYAAVPAHLLDEQSSLIDRLIAFAFDTVGARRLDVRVYDDVDRHPLAQCESC